MTPIPDHGCTPSWEEQEPNADGLADVLEERPLVRLPNYVANERCDRCDEKNQLRRTYGLEEIEERFADGERVRLVCLFDVEEPEEGWVVTTAVHTGHPMKAKEDVARPSLAQAQVTARLEREGWTYQFDPVEEGEDPIEYHAEDRAIVRDVDDEWFSPIGEGEEREPLREPDEHGHVLLKPTDPRPYWPEEENEWRESLMREHGDWTDGRDALSV